mmetsp:Transcript_55286/g.165696  ORF Transcript_55286/g.165696 Transcript_55286/m.165696 type:complete len:332 (-) Transcript_55286:2036-3031(-)
MTENLGSDLHDGGDARPPRDHVEAGGISRLSVNEEVAVGGVLELAYGASHVNSVPDLDGIEILGHLAPAGKPFGGTVRLDDELDATHVVVGGDGGVSTHDGLSVDLGREEHVLARGEAEDVFLGGERKVEEVRVVRQDRLGLKVEGGLMTGVECELVPLLVNGLLWNRSGRCRLGLDVKVANVVSFEHLGCLEGMDGDEIFRGVLPSVDDDGVNASGMELEVLSTVVDSVVHNDPHIRLLVVLVHLGHGENLRLCLLGIGSRSGRRNLRFALHLQETSISSRVGLARRGGHPSPLLLSRLGGMLESEDVLTAGGPVHVNLDPEHLIVPHPH